MRLHKKSELEAHEEEDLFGFFFRNVEPDHNNSSSHE